MEIIIDDRSGFCFGVKRAIELAEREALENTTLYCLGEIVHNEEEVNRLRKKGIHFIDRETYFTLSDCSVLFRAHGEPPEVYEYARQNNISIIDATCPVVLKLQEKVRNARKLEPDAQVVIYGKTDHPEVVGLKGQVDDTLILESIVDVEKIDYSKPVFLFAQTTKDRKQYAAIQKEIGKRLVEAGKPVENLITSNSICGQVANRAPWLAEFSKTVDALIFVGGKNSSNSKVLFEVCKLNNTRSFFITSVDEARILQIPMVARLGITGATSTPSWLISDVANYLKEYR
jgi:4-hydroxy-3-methylbut-2-enyl diphosphate reductase